MSRVMRYDSHPTILLEAAIAPKFLLFGSPSIGSFGWIEGISHTYAVDRLLGNAADAFGRRLARCLQYGGADVNDVLVLTSNLALRLDAFRPGDNQRHMRSTLEGSLFVIAERGVTRRRTRSEEHTSELQTLMRNLYADHCLNKQILHHPPQGTTDNTNTI